ncbi:hypothetical protein Mapa_008185 [Marchantia paleacea]|nr:hypothetical protein Mapa_008185 [Marchantia paleacea]
MEQNGEVKRIRERRSSMILQLDPSGLVQPILPRLVPEIITKPLHRRRRGSVGERGRAHLRQALKIAPSYGGRLEIPVPIFRPSSNSVPRIVLHVVAVESPHVRFLRRNIVEDQTLGMVLEENLMRPRDVVPRHSQHAARVGVLQLRQQAHSLLVQRVDGIHDE